MTALMSGADAFGALVLCGLWSAIFTLLGVWIGSIISRRNGRR